MKQLFTNQNRLLAMETKNYLESQGLKVEVKNENVADSALPSHHLWLELWVADDEYDKALQLLESREVSAGPDWQCASCSETNASSFQVCWKCQTPRQ